MRKITINTSTSSNSVISSAATVGELLEEQGLTISGQIATLNGAQATADTAIVDDDNILYLIPMMKAA